MTTVFPASGPAPDPSLDAAGAEGEPGAPPGVEEAVTVTVALPAPGGTDGAGRLGRGSTFGGLSSWLPGLLIACQTSQPARAVGASAARATRARPRTRRARLSGFDDSLSYGTVAMLAALLSRTRALRAAKCHSAPDVRRSTRSESVAETSVNAPDARARR
ncbi:hypothetical protein GCM10010388_48680 [Streptomyces mauvecolor]